ncbi:MAG: type II secretion system F family protein [Clostridia bacterium]|nr:type II secretion system F family protein [Clostridia bacterium]
MANYKYSGFDANGDKTRGVIQAGDQESAEEKLRAQGFIVTSIAETRAGGVGNPLDALGRVGVKDIVLFFRMFSALMASRVTITESIEILSEQAENRKLKRVLGQILDKISGGTPLSAAMAEHPRVFPIVAVNMIRAGELGGIMDVVLERISEYLEARAALKSKMIISLIYPGVVVVVSIVVVVFLVTFVIPKFATLLGGAKLPANTKFLLDTAEFLTTNAVAIITLGAGAILGFIVVLSVPATRILFDRYKIHIPVLGPIFRYGVIVQFSKTMASLLESGITLVDALRASAETISNEAVRAQIEVMNNRVVSGEPLSGAFENDRFFTPMVKAMIKIGEHSGLMDQAMHTVANLHEKILQNKIAKMTAMIEPLLIIILGGVVGYVAWGLVAGMLAMYTA